MHQSDDTPDTRRRHDSAWWYHAGRADQLRDDRSTTDVGTADGFAEYAAGQARDYYREARTYLPSVQDQWRTWVLICEHSDAGGPGKFEGNAFPAVASFIHQRSMDGCDETCGTVEYGPGWHGLVHLDYCDGDDVIALGWEPDVDAAPQSRPVAAIVAEDDRGFVDVTIYDSEDAALAGWAEVQEACDAAEDGDDTDEGL